MHVPLRCDQIQAVHQCSDPEARRRATRREFMRVGFVGGVGLALGDWFSLRTNAWAEDGSGDGAAGATAAGTAAAAARSAVAAEAVILLYMDGGMSHIDSFDPKPYAPLEIRGELGVANTKIDGIQYSGLWRETAGVAEHLAVIRSMTHGEAAHERGAHNMLTGHRPSPAIVYPSMGSVVAHELDVRNSIPSYVAVPTGGGGAGYAGTGYLSPAFGPFSIGGEPNNDQFSVRDLSLPPGVDETRMDRRKGLLRAVDAHFRSLESTDALSAMDAFYQKAYNLISSQPAREAFDIRREPDNIRNAYGRTDIGQRLLMARRLVEAGARFVTVFCGGWDMHKDVHGAMRGTVPPVDKAFAALIRDLAARGMLDKTLVSLTTEFGRTSRINNDRGRDHWPKVFNVVFAGGGVKGGQVIGASNAEATEPIDEPLGPADVSATVFGKLGIDTGKKLMSPGNRPIDLVREGRRIEQL